MTTGLRTRGTRHHKARVFVGRACAGCSNGWNAVVRCEKIERARMWRKFIEPTLRTCPYEQCVRLLPAAGPVLCVHTYQAYYPECIFFGCCVVYVCILLYWTVRTDNATRVENASSASMQQASSLHRGGGDTRNTEMCIVL